MRNRVRNTIIEKGGNILNVYFTAGHPKLDDTARIINELESNGVDLIELGMPYSDPLADGLTIQQSSEKALANGLTLEILFDQIEVARKKSTVPIILMGYFNQLLQYGVTEFLEKAALVGVDGMIIPDLPMNIYEKEYQSIFEKNNLSISFLISPLTAENRILQADKLSSGFLYVVSQSSITGKSNDVSDKQKLYFEKIESMGLDSPRLIGFGIHDKKSYELACTYSHGAIIGSAFIRTLNKEGGLEENIKSFISTIRS